jgi:G3E family GTPase
MSTPINVFTGYLGSGKTTIILNLVKTFPKDYKVVLLKNEFGNVKTDSQIASDQHIAVKEFVNGCLCCVLVGKIHAALEQIIDEFHPDRIIIETSGSAYPAPIAIEIRKMDQEKVHLDSIVTVIDAINFEGYEDTSYTARIQAKYTDLILINKHEEVEDEKLDRVLDDVYELNLDTPKIKTDNGHVDPDLVFGLDTKLFSELKAVHHENHDKHHHDKEVELYEIHSQKACTLKNFEEALKTISPRHIYRIKGMVKLNDNTYRLLNWSFGRYTFDPLTSYKGDTAIVCMGKGNITQHVQKLALIFEERE